MPELFTDRKAAPVFAIGPLERLASLSCVRPFRPVLHEAAISAAPARTLLWSPDLQPRPPLPHISVLAAEDIQVEHSCNTQRARTVVATGTALPFPLWRRESGLFPHSPRSGITKKGLVGSSHRCEGCVTRLARKANSPPIGAGCHCVCENAVTPRFVRDGSRGLVAAFCRLGVCAARVKLRLSQIARK
jgi:hypothetical protein